MGFRRRAKTPSPSPRPSGRAFGSIGARQSIKSSRDARHRRSPPSHRDLLGLLLGVRDAETGEALSDSEIRDQCATLFFAGSETTARLLFWACYLLAMDPDEQTRVREEVTAFRPKRIDGPADLQNWSRLRNVLLETLRLDPPLPQIVRVANGPDATFAAKKLAPTRRCGSVHG